MDELLVETKETGDAADVVAVRRQVESAILTDYDDARGQMEPFRERWARYYDMYMNDWTPPADDSPFAQFNVPKLARVIDLVIANVMGATIPDKMRLDFFRLAPVPPKRNALAPEDQEAMAKLAEYASLAEACIREDLQLSDWMEGVFRPSLKDLFVTGNMFTLLIYDEDIRTEFKRELNPFYDPSKSPEANYVLDESGAAVPVPQFVKRRIKVREYDAPRARYLNPQNVVPSRLDVSTLDECEWVAVYDTVTLAELRDDEIATGGALYAFLDELEAHGEDDDVSMVEGHDESVGGGGDPVGPSAGVRALKRVTLFGRFDWERIKQETRIADDPGLWEQLIDAYNVDRDKLENWNTWVIEIIRDADVMIRCQPLPYDWDRKPIIQQKLLSRPNRLLGEGCYKRDEMDERIWNFLNRLSLDLTLKLARPPIGIQQDAFDPAWLNSQEGKLRITGDMLVQLRRGSVAKIGEALQQMRWDPTALGAIRDSMAQREAAMEQQTHLPAIRQGVASGAATATEMSTMNANSGLILEEWGQQIESGYLKETIRWFYKLHHQFSETSRFVSAVRDGGELEVFNVPPDVWLSELLVTVVGIRTTGNKAVQAMNFKEFCTVARAGGFLNEKEAIRTYAKMLEVRDYDKLVQDAPPPQEEKPKTSFSVTGKLEMLPVTVQAQILQEAGFTATPQELAETMDERNNGIKVGPGGVPVDKEAGRSHHAPGEVENRQRGLHDETGVQKSLGQQSRDPNNSRRAMQ